MIISSVIVVALTISLLVIICLDIIAIVIVIVVAVVVVIYDLTYVIIIIIVIIGLRILRIELANAIGCLVSITNTIRYATKDSVRRSDLTRSSAAHESWEIIDRIA